MSRSPSHTSEGPAGAQTVDLVLAPGREKSVERRHPWVFSGAVASRSGAAGSGLGRVFSADGRLLGWALVSPQASLVARMLTFGDTPRPDGAFFRERIRAALALRRDLLPPGVTGYRVIHAEADGIPGLVVDRFGSVVVVQVGTAGLEQARSLWLPPLLEALAPETCLQKNNLPARKEEGLPLEDQVLAGPAPAGPIPFEEHGITFMADVVGGQKTGFYLDQRENRQLVRGLARGRSVLECYAYTGAFGVAALLGGARRVVSVDASAPALEGVRRHRQANGFPVEDGDLVRADVPEDLRRRVAAGETWGLVVLDPPPFARKRADVERAPRAYKDIQRLALRLLSPGGLLLACSCSGGVDGDLFQKILFGASLDAQVPVQILERRGAGWDHPVSVDCPETEYLKALLVRRT